MTRIQYTGSNYSEIKDLLGDKVLAPYFCMGFTMLSILTEEGFVSVQECDWIVLDDDGTIRVTNHKDLFTYQFGPGVEAFTTQRDSVLPYPVIQGHQVHGSRVAVIDRPWMTREELEGYDAFVTNLPGVAIGVRTADCVPILIYDPSHRVIAAVHSGWKGTVLKISQSTIKLMGEQFGTTPEDLLAVIGPCIGPKSFQVGEEVVEKFKDAGFPMPQIWSFQGDGDGSPMSGGHHIDLPLANRWILQECGMRTKNIRVFPIDTYQDPAFYSARREGVQCGRNINAIRMI